MLFNYNEEEDNKRTVKLRLETGEEVLGEFMDVRIKEESLPSGRVWYHIRHKDEDDMEAGAVKRGCVLVNFFGTLICGGPIHSIPDVGEVSITDWTFID